MGDGVYSGNFATKAELPTASTSAPPAVADESATGTGATVYALANHTHASKTRKIRIQTGSDGLVTWTFSPAFDVGVTPRVVAIAETTSVVTDVVNVQVEGAPTNTSCVLRVTRTNRSVAATLGLTVLSVQAVPGATWVHALAMEP